MVFTWLHAQWTYFSCINLQTWLNIFSNKKSGLLTVIIEYSWVKSPSLFRELSLSVLGQKCTQILRVWLAATQVKFWTINKFFILKCAKAWLYYSLESTLATTFFGAVVGDGGRSYLPWGMTKFRSVSWWWTRDRRSVGCDHSPWRLLGS